MYTCGSAALGATGLRKIAMEAPFLQMAECSDRGEGRYSCANPDALDYDYACAYSNTRLWHPANGVAVVCLHQQPDLR
jgi:hypothetical protein